MNLSGSVSAKAFRRLSNSLTNHHFFIYHSKFYILFRKKMKKAERKIQDFRSLRLNLSDQFSSRAKLSRAASNASETRSGEVPPI